MRGNRRRVLGPERRRVAEVANRRMQSRQSDPDNDTDHGAKAGVPYGDVILDTLIP